MGGHFTAMVWKGVKEIGCATTKSKGRPWYVCRYKAGNRLSGSTPNMGGHYRANVLKPRKDAKAECAGAATIEGVRIKKCTAWKKDAWKHKKAAGACAKDSDRFCAPNKRNCKNRTAWKRNWMLKKCPTTCCTNGCCKKKAPAVKGRVMPP